MAEKKFNGGGLWAAELLRPFISASLFLFIRPHIFLSFVSPPPISLFILFLFSFLNFIFGALQKWRKKTAPGRSEAKADIYCGGYYFAGYFSIHMSSFFWRLLLLAGFVSAAINQTSAAFIYIFITARNKSKIIKKIMGRKKNKNKSDFIKTTSDISLVSWISLFPLGLSLHNGFYFSLQRRRK